ncbi:MAG: hypothetical protein QW517_03645 [Thermofilaceae archaeon]
MEELRRGVEAAKALALVCSTFYRRRVRLGESEDGVALLILLKLAEAGGSAPFSRLVEGNPEKARAALESLRGKGLVRLFETPFRTYAVLTEEGWRAAGTLLRVLSG